MSSTMFHLSFPVRCLESAIEFYCQVLGAQPGRREPGWADVILFGHQITLHERPEQVLPKALQGVRHFGAVLAAQAWETLAAYLLTQRPECVEAQRRIGEGTRGEHGKLLLRDPDGQLIELKYYHDPATVTPALAG